MKKKLYLSRTDKKIAGVFGGLGEYLDVDSTLLRVLWIILTVFSGIIPGVLIYLLMWVVMPGKNTTTTQTSSLFNGDQEEDTARE